jgi:Right handed beta helix region
MREANRFHAAWIVLLALAAAACDDDPATVNRRVTPGEDRPVQDAGIGEGAHATSILAPSAPSLPSCLQGDEPEGCANLPSLADWTCPEGWNSVSAFSLSGVPTGMSDAAVCVPRDELSCAQGEVQQLGDDGCSLVGDPCPSGEWPASLPAQDVIFVRAGSSGDGTESAPMGTIDEALAAAQDGSIIALAAGTYQGPVEIDRDLTIWGRCTSEVYIEGPASTISPNPMVPETIPGTIQVAGANLVLRNVTVTGERTGIRVLSGGSLDARGVHVSENLRTGVHVSQGTAHLTGSVISDTRPQDGERGRGLQVDFEGEVTLERCRIDRNHDMGLACFDAGSSLILSDVTIADTSSQPADGTYGVGLHVGDCAALTIRRTSLLRNQSAGMFIASESPTPLSVDAEDVFLTDTRGQDAGDEFGWGIIVEGNVQGRVERAVLLRNREAAIAVTGSGLLRPDLELMRLVVAETQPNETDGFGRALTLRRGGNLVVRGALFDGNHEMGVVVTGAGSSEPTSATFEDLVVRKTQPQRSDGEFGRGMTVQDGATVVVERALFDANHEVAVMATANDGEADPSLTMTDVTIRGTLPRSSDGKGGRAVGFEAGTSNVTRLTVRDCAEAALFAAKGTTTLAQVLVTDTRSEQSPDGIGRGLNAQDGARVIVSEAVLLRNRELAVLAAGDTHVELSDVWVRGTLSRESDLDGGRGIAVQDGAYLQVERGRLEANQGHGVIIQDPGTIASLSDVAILGTTPNACGLLAPGAPKACVESIGPWGVKHGAGTGLAILQEATLTIARFDIDSSTLCGMHLGSGAQVEASMGVVHQNTVGLNVADANMDLSQVLTPTVRWFDNDVSLGGSVLPVPGRAEVLAAMGAAGI